MPDPKPPDDLELLEELAGIESGLTGWEMDRIEEWLPMVERGGRLTEKQRAAMERALERVEESR